MDNNENRDSDIVATTAQMVKLLDLSDRHKCLLSDKECGLVFPMGIIITGVNSEVV